jgi:hypothetical protein
VKVTPVTGNVGRGHARSFSEILRLLGDQEFAGLLDAKPELHGTKLSGVRVPGFDFSGLAEPAVVNPAS